MANIFLNENAEALIGTYEIFKSVADSLFRNGLYRKAIESYTYALKHLPNDRMTLVCRSRCYLMLGDTGKALQDAESSLAENKNYYMGMFQKAEVLFSRGDFEMALVYYHRGNKLRPEFHNFRLGIQKAQESICNCVGTPDRVKLNTTGDLSFFTAHLEKKSKKKGALCTQTQQTVQRLRRPSEKRGNEKTIKQMLGDLYGDRKFLEKLLLETDTMTITGKRVVNFADEGLTYLDSLADFWQKVKPLYARKYEQRLALNRGRSAKISPHDYIHHEIEKAEQMMVEGNYEAAVQKSHKVMTLLEDYTETQLSRKMAFVANLHSILGNAYLELNDFESSVKEHLIDLSIGEECFADQAKLRALDNLGRVYAKSGNFHKAIEVWERKLPLSKEESETAWICLELGRCYLELDNTAVAKDYGEKSLAAAEETRDDRWKLHAYVLISEANVRSGRLSSALINFEKAYELAVLLRDSETKAAIGNAIADVHIKIKERELVTGIDLHEDLLTTPINDEKEDILVITVSDENDKIREPTPRRVTLTRIEPDGGKSFINEARRESLVTSLKQEHTDTAPE